MLNAVLTGTFTLGRVVVQRKSRQSAKLPTITLSVAKSGGVSPSNIREQTTEYRLSDHPSIREFASGDCPALFGRLSFVRLYGGYRPHTVGFVPMGLPARQQDMYDSQQHHHESIHKERAISQHKNVTENYGGHPYNSQSHSQPGCLSDQKQNRHPRLEYPRP
jgi:hypothetical protein